MTFRLVTRDRRAQHGPTRDPRPPCAARPGVLFLLAAALLAALLAAARQVNYGPGLAGDSLQYVAAARSLAAGEGFVNGRGSVYATYPPLYPLAAAAVERLTGLDSWLVVGPLNALLFGLTAFVAGRYLRRRLESRFLAAWGCAAIALSPPLTDAASWALSESLFVLLTVLALIEAEEFLRAGGRRRLLAAAAWSSAVWLTRYIGVAAPFFVGLLVLLRKGVPLRRKVWEGAAFALAAGLLPALWMLRNYLLVGEFGGKRAMYDVSLRSVLRGAGGVLGDWTHFELPAAVGAGAVLAAACWGALRPRAADGGRAAADGGGFAAGRSVAVWGGFALAYGVLFVAAAWAGYSDPEVRPRYVTPLYAPLLLAGAFALDGLLRRVRPAAAGPGGSSPAAGRLAAGLAAGLAAVGALWTAGQAAAHVERIGQAAAGRPPGDMKPGFGAPPYAESETLAWLRENPLDGVVYTNGTIDLLCLHNAGEAAYRDLEVNMDRRYRFAPYDGRPAERSEEPGSAGQDGLEAELAAAPEGAWLVWFKRPAANNAVGYGAPWLRVSPSLEVAAELADGGVYRRASRAGRGSRVAGRGSGRAAHGSRGSGVAGRGSGGGFDVSWRGGSWFTCGRGVRRRRRGCGFSCTCMRGTRPICPPSGGSTVSTTWTSFLRNTAQCRTGLAGWFVRCRSMRSNASKRGKRGPRLTARQGLGVGG